MAPRPFERQRSPSQEEGEKEATEAAPSSTLPKTPPDFMNTSRDDKINQIIATRVMKVQSIQQSSPSILASLRQELEKRLDSQQWTSSTTTNLSEKIQVTLRRHYQCVYDTTLESDKRQVSMNAIVAINQALDNVLGPSEKEQETETSSRVHERTATKTAALRKSVTQTSNCSKPNSGRCAFGAINANVARDVRTREADKTLHPEASLKKPPPSIYPSFPPQQRVNLASPMSFKRVSNSSGNLPQKRGTTCFAIYQGDDSTPIRYNGSKRNRLSVGTTKQNMNDGTKEDQPAHSSSTITRQRSSHWDMKPLSFGYHGPPANGTRTYYPPKCPPSKLAERLPTRWNIKPCYDGSAVSPSKIVRKVERVHPKYILRPTCSSTKIKKSMRVIPAWGSIRDKLASSSPSKSAVTVGRKPLPGRGESRHEPSKCDKVDPWEALADMSFSPLKKKPRVARPDLVTPPEAARVIDLTNESPDNDSNGGHAAVSTEEQPPKWVKSSKTNWKEEEDHTLHAGVHWFSGGNVPKDWDCISEKFFSGRRSPLQCLLRWNALVSKGLRRGEWTPKEDAMVSRSRPWKDITKQLPGRNRSKIEDRYSYDLYLSLKTSPWTVKEDKTLVEMQAELGDSWVVIGNTLNRSTSQVKNRFHIMKQKSCEHSAIQSTIIPVAKKSPAPVKDTKIVGV